MKEEFKFIRLKNSDGDEIVINVDQIVSIRKNEDGCYIKTTLEKAGISTNVDFETVISLLPSVLSIKEIN